MEQKDKAFVLFVCVFSGGLSYFDNPAHLKKRLQYSFKSQPQRDGCVGVWVVGEGK